MPAAQRVWFITGVSSGLGRAIAQAALGHGDQVIGTLRNADQVSDFEALAPGLATACLLDVTKLDSVHSTLTQAIQNKGRIDVVVNNAGYGLAGAAEEVSEDEISQQMTTNFNGLIAVTQAALPFMRAQKCGHIINISSVAGFKGIPGMSIYAASKHAVEGFSESLALEAAHLGIKVTLVEPGAFRTNWSSNNAIVRSANVIDDYAPTAGLVRNGLSYMDGKQENDPAKGAQAILKVVDSSNPPLRLPLGTDAVKYVRDKLSAMSLELDAWESIASSTAFDQ